MRPKRWLALAAFGVVLTVTGVVQSQRPPANETLPQRLARTSNLKEEEVNRVLNALGPVLTEEPKMRSGWVSYHP